jgi:hypothetical protein
MTERQTKREKARDYKLIKLGANTKATNKQKQRNEEFSEQEIGLCKAECMKMKLLSMGLGNNVHCAKTMLEMELRHGSMGFPLSILHLSKKWPCNGLVLIVDDLLLAISLIISLKQ